MADGLRYDAADIVSCTVGGIVVVPPGARRRFVPDPMPLQMASNEGWLIMLREWNWEVVGVQVQPVVETRTFIPSICIKEGGDDLGALRLDGGWLLRGCEPVTPYRVRRRMNFTIEVGWYGEPRHEIPVHVSVRGFFVRVRD